jgi:hypothetical protein
MQLRRLGAVIDRLFAYRPAKVAAMPKADKQKTIATKKQSRPKQSPARD